MSESHEAQSAESLERSESAERQSRGCSTSAAGAFAVNARVFCRGLVGFAALFGLAALVGFAASPLVGLGRFAPS